MLPITKERHVHEPEVDLEVGVVVVVRLGCGVRLGFGVLGVFAGALGHALIIGPVGLAVAMVVAGVAMVAVGLQMTVISPRLAV